MDKSELKAPGDGAHNTVRLSTIPSYFSQAKGERNYFEIHLSILFSLTRPAPRRKFTRASSAGVG